jgi:CHAD domain-containing protein
VAKAEDIETSGSEPFRRAGARIVRTRADELFAQAEGVLDIGDIERVHDMRVASRRLRAVLEIFAVCFPPAEFKGVLKDVKALADALGERRDPDVHIDALTAFARALTPAQRSGVTRLVEEQRALQAEGNEVLAAALQRMEERGLHERLHALADAAEEEEAEAQDQIAAAGDDAAEPATPGHDAAAPAALEGSP